MIRRMLTSHGGRALRVLAIAAALGAGTGCIALTDYDFGGYRLGPGTRDAGGGGSMVDEGGAPDISVPGDDAGPETSAPDDAGCIPRTCAELHAECGKIPDGCDGVLDCGACDTGVCGGGGRNRCGDDPCMPRTCADLGASCGQVSDNCGGTIECGRCVSPETCGGGGMSKKCGCTPVTCPQAAAECGMIADGCGHMIDCGECRASGTTCGGGGVANRCGCAPATCASKNANCGTLPDGCGGMLDCKSCSSPAVCGGGGPNKCGNTPCTPKSCTAMGVECGSTADGCGQVGHSGDACGRHETGGRRR